MSVQNSSWNGELHTLHFPEYSEGATFSLVYPHFFQYKPKGSSALPRENVCLCGKIAVAENSWHLHSSRHRELLGPFK